MLRKWSILTPILIVLVVLFASITPARADEEWHAYYDFTDGQHGFTYDIANGSPTAGYQAGVGWVATNWHEEVLNYANTRALLNYTFTGQVDITGVTLELGGLTFGSGLANGDWVVVFAGRYGSPLATKATAHGAGDYSSTFTQSYTNSLGNAIDVRCSDDAYGGAATITGLHLYGTGMPPQEFIDDATYFVGPPGGTDIVRPLAEEDEHPQWEMFDYHYVHDIDPDWDVQIDDVYAFSDQWGAYVHAAVEGEVVKREPFTLADCQAAQPIPLEICYVIIPPAITDDGTTHAYRLNLTDAPIFKVWLRAGGGVIQYIVANADEYVEPGTTVREGCILGKTIQLQHLLNAEVKSLQLGLEAGAEGVGISGSVEFQLRSILTDYGVTFLAFGDPDTGDTFPLLPYLTLEASLFQACNENPLYTSCYGDPELRRPDEWTETGVVAWNKPGVTLSTNLSRISRVLPLEEGNEYSMTVNATQTGAGNGLIRLQLGGTVVDTTITAGVGNMARYEIEADTHEPDYAGMYTIAITNAGTAPLRIHTICVTDGAPNPTKNSCYFYNQTFDNGNTGWTVSGGIQNWGGGDIRVPDQDTFTQDVHLYPDDGSTYYRVSAHVSLWTIPGYTPSTNNWEDTVALEYQWPGAASWVPIPSPSSSTTASFAQFAYDPKLEFSWVLHVSSETNGTWTFRPTIDTEDTNVLGITVYDVCLEYSGGAFPGFTYDPEPYNPTCAYIGPPAGNTIGDWIAWHWAHLNRFFSCELMVLLNSIYELILDFKDMVGWAIRYINAVAWHTGNWLGTDLFPWLEGHFYNIAVGHVIVVEGEEGEHSALPILDDIGNWIGDRISDFVNWIVGGIGDFLRSIFGWLIDIINFLVNVVLQVILIIVNAALWVGGQLLSGAIEAIQRVSDFILAWNNAEPHAVAGLPQCAVNPKESSFCIVLWMLEHTIFSGRGALLPYLLVFGASVELIIWWLDRLQKTVEHVSQDT